MKGSEEEKGSLRITDVDALHENIEAAVFDFANQWMPVEDFSIDCVVMDQGQLRDAMGLRNTIEVGDPWPTAERLLLGLGFRWHRLGFARVMYLREKDSVVPADVLEDTEELDES